jgi:hypothetical protein
VLHGQGRVIRIWDYVSLGRDLVDQSGKDLPVPIPRRQNNHIGMIPKVLNEG